jgi:hypothetical protein
MAVIGRILPSDHIVWYTVINVSEELAASIVSMLTVAQLMSVDTSTNHDGKNGTVYLWPLHEAGSGSGPDPGWTWC